MHLPVAALVLNTHRRHMTAEQRREQVLRLKGWGWSNPRIAEVIGVSKDTVAREVESAACASEQAALPAKVSGADGKSYPPPSLHPRR